MYPIRALFLMLHFHCSFSLSILGLNIGLNGARKTKPTTRPPPPPLNYGSYYKGPVCNPSSYFQYPENLADVVSFVNIAIKNHQKVKAHGSLHSATDIICTDGIPFDMRGINDMTINADLTVTVGAGARLHDVAEFLLTHDRAFRLTPGYGGVTIGGAIGTGSHGSSLVYNSSISEQVVGVIIVDGLGNVQNITDETELRAFRANLGLLGIVVYITLDTVPIYKVRGWNYITSDSMLFDGTFLNYVSSTDQVSIYWFPSFNKIVYANWTIVDANEIGDAETNDHVPSTSRTFNKFIVPALEFFQTLDSVQLLNIGQAMMMATLVKKVPFFQPIYTENGATVSNPAVGYYHRMFAPICDDRGSLQCPWFHGEGPVEFNITQLDNEMAVDVQDIPDIARTLKDIVSKYAAVFPFQGILLRFSRASQTYMSNAYGRQTCHFEFYVPHRRNLDGSISYDKASSGLAAYQTIMQSLAHDYRARTHWGKSGSVYSSANVLTKNLDDEALASFLAAMEKYDPKGVFMNDFGERLKGTGTAINNDPEQLAHCALLDNCFCDANSDCAAGQRCSSISGYEDFPVCMNTQNPLKLILNPNLTWEDISWLSFTFDTVRSLINILKLPAFLVSGALQTLLAVVGILL